MTPEKWKRTRVLLLVAGALTLLLAAQQTALYCFANAHLKEILQNGSAKLLGVFSVTENAALANPTLTSAAFAALFAAACFFGAHWIGKKHSA